jgi:hypothetical protein
MDAAPPKISPPSRSDRRVIFFLAVAALAAAAMVFFLNPATHRFYPVCQFHKLTGLNCPGCGMTRSVFALLHGNIQTAIRDNALLVGVICLLALRGGWWTWKKIASGRELEFFPGKWLWPLLALALGFGVVRNLPMFAFLSP